MRKLNVQELAEEAWTSPKGSFAGFGKEVSIALGREPGATDLAKRHPFDVEITRVAPGQRPYAYHSHSEQWEFYHVLSGRGSVRHEAGVSAIEAGDAFIFRPGEPHQLINGGTQDLVLLVIADNPLSESCYYPDSGKWLVYSPARRVMRSEPLDYYDGED